MVDASGLTGVRFLDHTADVGIDVEAGTLPELFHRAALGMLALLRGDDDPAPRSPAPSRAGHAARGTGHRPSDAQRGPAGEECPPAGEERPVPVSERGDGWAAVLAGWLRELLFLHETGGRDYRGAEFGRLDASGFDATVHTEPARRAVREIKGVTYHELAVEETETGWRARVIFDV